MIMSEEPEGVDTEVTQPENTTQPSEPTLRARISTWLSKRALSSVIVAAVLAFILGIGFGGIVMQGKDHFREHRMEHRWDRDGRGPGMMDRDGFGGPGNQFDQRGPGGNQDGRGPGMMPGGPGQPTPIASPSDSAQ